MAKKEYFKILVDNKYIFLVDLIFQKNKTDEKNFLYFRDPDDPYGMFFGKSELQPITGP